MLSQSTPLSAAAVNVKLVDLRNSRHIHWLSTVAEHPDVSTKVEARQSLHSLYCIRLNRQGDRIYARAIACKTRHNTKFPMLR